MLFQGLSVFAPQDNRKICNFYRFYLNISFLFVSDHVWELAKQSENKTLHIFSQVYYSMAELSTKPIEILYRDIRDYVKIDPSDQKPTKTPSDIVASVNQFFTELFPLAYHQQTGLSSGDFYHKIQTFQRQYGCDKNPLRFPKQVSDSLSKSLETTRLLLEALGIGMEVLNTTHALIIDEHATTNSECHTALLKMTYCPKCLALPKHNRPCSDYCLNVMRGCLNKYVAELDLPWNVYVEGIENLINAVKKNSNEGGTNVDIAIKNLDVQISSAIMYSMEKIKEIIKGFDRRLRFRVKMNCKIAEYTKTEESRTTETSATTESFSKMRQSNVRSFSHFPTAHMSLFLSTMTKTKGFYASLADNLCREESFAEQKDKLCWNGERIAEYTKTVVDVGLMQKYNPEVKTSPNSQHVDPKIATLVDKLRHVHYMAVKSLGPNYSDPDYMQRDGVDGSGSGSGPDFDEEDEYSRGSGSGHGPIDGDDEVPRHHSVTPDHSEKVASTSTKTSN
ncbi:division abnormally delayed protein-like [Sitophilus oryzae]|uniref:Division abnormally delayed protein-like n=1 Tax=Sitophilus oryzae TaxID=7048 RepID=A0A6J2X655_SITOR|nr:division abnormally delayed protein-like [Sitophilus oryzae]